MTETLAAALFILAGLINLTPVVGMMGGRSLTRLYGVTFTEPTLLLMRHRAVLFGLVGGLLIAAAFDLALRVAATLVGLVSMLAFVALMRTPDRVGRALRTVFIVDCAGSVALAAAFLLHAAQVRA
jgi:hypothetical protein